MMITNGFEAWLIWSDSSLDSEFVTSDARTSAFRLAAKQNRSSFLPAWLASRSLLADLTSIHPNDFRLVGNAWGRSSLGQAHLLPAFGFSAFHLIESLSSLLHRQTCAPTTIELSQVASRHMH